MMRRQGNRICRCVAVVNLICDSPGREGGKAVSPKALATVLAMALAVALWTGAQAQAPGLLKIMPLGDSITFGSPDRAYGGYRHALGALLAKDGYAINFVGSQRSGIGIIPNPDHEGHSGWTIAQIKSGIDTDRWLEAYRPDIILLHIGTNDLRRGDAAAAQTDLSALLDDIRSRLPEARIIVAQIIPFRRGPDPAHRAYNAAIPAMIAAKGALVSMVNMEAILAAEDYADGLHPNDGGYDKMARAWEAAIRDALARAKGKG
jgi:lysophospholipase L1-like esterase